jgi:hypothetical protein
MEKYMERLVVSVDVCKFCRETRHEHRPNCPTKICAHCDPRGVAPASEHHADIR